MFDTIFNALELGMIFGVMSLGIFITFKLLKLPDLTIDGSFTLGMAVAGIFTAQDHPYLGLGLALLCGALAGIVTGLLHTKLYMDPILSGILTMTGLYSINLRIMGNRPNLSITGHKDLYGLFSAFLPDAYVRFGTHLIVLLVISAVLFAFLRTQIGVSMIATGDNEDMVRASSINADSMKILGLGIGNALVAFAGGMMVSYGGFADVNGGGGMMVIGIASIIVGATIFGEKNLLICFGGVVFGAIAYRYILALALSMGLRPGDLKLLSALLIILAVGIPAVQARRKGDR